MRQTFRRTSGLFFALILSASVIYSDAPDGYQIFDGLEDQFTIALPAGWSVYDQTHALSGKAGLRGTVVFSAERLTKEGEALGDPAAMARADTGDLPSFFVDRKAAAKGMTCAKFTKPAAYNLGAMLTEDPIFGALRRRFSATPIHHDPMSIGGCHGYHYKGDGKNGQWTLDVRAVSDGKTLYLFSLRSTAENFGKNIGTFEKAMETLRIATHE